MFQFIYFNVYEIFVAFAVVMIVGVLIFAMKYRAKLDALEAAGAEPSAEAAQGDFKAMREVGLSSAGVAQVNNTDIKSKD